MNYSFNHVIYLVDRLNHYYYLNPKQVNEEIQHEYQINIVLDNNRSGFEILKKEHFFDEQKKRFVTLTRYRAVTNEYRSFVEALEREYQIMKSKIVKEDKKNE